MSEEIRRMFVAFVGGMTTFVTIPFFISPASRQEGQHAKMGQVRTPDVSRYFGATGQYISGACRKLEADRS